MSELKECPFCGGEAKLIDWGDEFAISVDHRDGCWMDEYEGYADITADVKQEAIEAWNTRHERKCKWKTVREGSSIKATECGQLYDWYPLDIPKHCPGCGAKVIKND